MSCWCADCRVTRNDLKTWYFHANIVLTDLIQPIFLSLQIKIIQSMFILQFRMGGVSIFNTQWDTLNYEYYILLTRFSMHILILFLTFFFVNFFQIHILAKKRKTYSNFAHLLLLTHAQRALFFIHSVRLENEKCLADWMWWFKFKIEKSCLVDDFNNFYWLWRLWW